LNVDRRVLNHANSKQDRPGSILNWRAGVLIDSRSVCTRSNCTLNFVDHALNRLCSISYSPDSILNSADHGLNRFKRRRIARDLIRSRIDSPRYLSATRHRRAEIMKVEGKARLLHLERVTTCTVCACVWTCTGRTFRRI